MASCTVIKAEDSDDFDIQDEEDYESCKDEWKRKVPKKCPAIDPTNTTIHLAHETDCEKFYMCLGGEKIEQICPPRNNKGQRLHFNKRCQVCDWPGAAKCENTGDGDITTTPETSIPGCNKSKEWEDCSDKKDGTLLPHECCLCDRFYLCRDGDKIAKQCPKDKYFSMRYQGCVYKDDSDCPKEIGECEKDGDLLPHECKCENYYECQDDEKILRHCPDGLHFNEEERECQDPEDAGCEEIPDKKPGKCPKGKTDGDEWPHECDCRLYYRCVQGKMKIQACHWGDWFDDETKTCKPEKDVECENGCKL